MENNFIACRPNHDNVTSEARCIALLAASFLRITDLKACDSHGQLGQRTTQPFGIFDQMESMSVSLGIQNSVVHRKDHPHVLIIDPVKSAEIAGARYIPRQGSDGVTGRIKEFRMYVAENPVSE